MTAYLLAEAKVVDPLTFAAYQRLADVAVAQYGGRYLVQGGAAEVLEGKWSPPQQLVVVEFPSVAQARQFYDSPEYQAARQARAGAADMNMLVVAGL